MKGRFPPTKLIKYPHLAPEDIVIWERFLERYAGAYESVDYDIRVGEGEPPLPTLEPKYAAMAKALTQKRIDAVAYRPGEIWIFEVKPRAALSALGQIISYTELYILTFNPTETIVPAVVCEMVDHDVKPLMTNRGIQVIIV